MSVFIEETWLIITKFGNVFFRVTKSECMMKKYLAFLGAAITAGMLTVPAYAADSPSYYISGNIGETWCMDNDIIPRNKAGNLSTTAGLTLMGAVGMKFCDTCRLEAELGYQRNNADHITFNTEVYRISGLLSETSILANGYYDFKRGTINPYLTAGLGWAGFDVNGLNGRHGLHGLSETHSAFAYQFGAGASIPVTKHIDMDVRYRYARTSTMSLDNNYSTFQLASNSALLGLRVGF